MWYIIIIVIIIIIIIIISFKQGIYTYIPETNYVPREYSAAAILLFLFMVLISLVSVLNLLHFYISTFRSMCAVPNMAVLCIIIIIIIIISVAIKEKPTSEICSKHGISESKRLYERIKGILEDNTN